MRLGRTDRRREGARVLYGIYTMSIIRAGPPIGNSDEDSRKKLD